MKEITDNKTEEIPQKPRKKPFFLKAVLIALVILIIAFLVIPPIFVYSGKYKIYRNVESVEKHKVGIVFGAGVHSDGSPTPMLQDRLDTAARLYEMGKIEKILVSGDNRTEHYNEPQAMYNYLLQKKIPKKAIIRDYAGRRTYDTCYRANYIFGLKEAILITQGYHLPRAIFLCNKLGVKSSGISATMRDYQNEATYETREIAAIYASILDIYILKPTPVLGQKIKI